MELHQLRYFVAVAEEKSFSRAAERVRVAQPSLSQQIQKLEGEIGQPLFDRLPRGVAITEAGHGLLPYARKILGEIANAQTYLAEFEREPTGTVVVGMIPTIAPYISQQLLSAVAAAYPRLRVRLIEETTDGLLRMTEAAAVDCAILSTCRRQSGLHLERWASESLLVAVPPNSQLAQRASVTARDLRREPVLQLHESHCLSERVARWCRANGVPIGDEIPALQLGTLLAAVAAGRGICFVPKLARKIEAVHGCVFVPFKSGGPTREINLVRNVSRYQTKSTAAFTTIARGLVKAITTSHGEAEGSAHGFP